MGLKAEAEAAEAAKAAAADEEIASKNEDDNEDGEDDAEGEEDPDDANDDDGTGLGEVAFDNEIDLSGEVEWWQNGQAIRPESQNLVTRVKSTENVDEYAHTAYKFNIDCSKKKGQPSSYVSCRCCPEGIFVVTHSLWAALCRFGVRDYRQDMGDG